ncbi:hypothetical protein CVT24_007221 [Panaeolus cyanescens]|uniref:FAD-binding domain-containing protein n=1 Tax=Panaeolus cyanescens TaxID=181874 RepID=A0A409VJE6_9AGAR|nr:hypothetical protein CVT24_007221 [Panaeolus cyanescens]
MGSLELNEKWVDVLVVGSGPAGLMACNALTKMGLKVHIVDKRSVFSKVMVGQADGLQPRTLEVLQSYGLLGRILEEGNQMHIAAFYNPGPDGGIEVSFSTTCSDKRSTSRWLLGAHSWVRKQCGIAMEGEQSEDIWGVIDFKVPETNFPDIRNRCMVHSTNGSCMIIPREEEKVRFYIQLEEKNVMTDGRVDKNKISALKIFEVTRKQMLPYKFAIPEEFEWFTIYIIGQRVASRFSHHDRVFIVGDACHTHSPKAGLGMNASMNDSHNLAWKIAHVMKGYAKASLLQTYELERRQYALDLINFDKKFARLFTGKPKTEIDMDGVSHEEFLHVYQTSAGFTTGIGIHYAESQITDATYQSLATNLIIGQRFVPHIFLRAADAHPVEIHDLIPSDGRFKILIFSGDTTRVEVIQKIVVLSESHSLSHARRHVASERNWLTNNLMEGCCSRSGGSEGTKSDEINVSMHATRSRMMESEEAVSSCFPSSSIIFESKSVNHATTPVIHSLAAALSMRGSNRRCQKRLNPT